MLIQNEQSKMKWHTMKQNEENVLYIIEKLLIIGTEIRSFYFYKWERGAYQGIFILGSLSSKHIAIQMYLVSVDYRDSKNFLDRKKRIIKTNKKIHILLIIL
jgi:hypothetical protein